MSDIATISDDELRDMRETYAAIQRGPLDPSNEADRHAIAGIVPMMVALLDEVLRQRKWAREMVEMAASGGRLDGYRELADKLAAKDAEIDRLRAELRVIAAANPAQWEADVRDQFQAWAQNRARAAMGSE